MHGAVAGSGLGRRARCPASPPEAGDAGLAGCGGNRGRFLAIEQTIAMAGRVGFAAGVAAMVAIAAAPVHAAAARATARPVRPASDRAASPARSERGPNAAMTTAADGVRPGATISAQPSQGTSAPVIQGGLFVVKNNTRSRVLCRQRTTGLGWSELFPFASGAEFSRRQRSAGDLLYFSCGAPVRHVIYKVYPGERYSLLPRQDGVVVLRRIVP